MSDNTSEFYEWLDAVPKLPRVWLIDPVTWHNKKNVLMVKGGVEGVYISINPEGLVRAGVYSGAYTNIGDALFKQQAHIKFDTFSLAVRFFYNLGIECLSSIIQEGY